MKKSAQRMNAWQSLQRLEEEEEQVAGLDAEKFPTISQNLLHSSLKVSCACCPTSSTHVDNSRDIAIDIGACGIHKSGRGDVGNAWLSKASNSNTASNGKGHGGKGAYQSFRIIATAEEAKAVSEQINFERGRSKEAKRIVASSQTCAGLGKGNDDMHSGRLVKGNGHEGHDEHGGQEEHDGHGKHDEHGTSTGLIIPA